MPPGKRRSISQSKHASSSGNFALKSLIVNRFSGGMDCATFIAKTESHKSYLTSRDIYLAFCLNRLASAARYDLQQVEKYEDVDDEQTDPDPRDLVDDLEDLPGEERSGDDESEDFAPSLLEVKADSLG